MRTCTTCGKQAKARGLCSTHYNQTHQVNRHKKVMVACDCCGQQAAKDARSAPRYEHTYCSELCRDYARWGGQSCALPATHWARMYGTTCEWTAPHIIDCAWCGETSITARNTARFCGDVCARKHGRARRRGREHDAIGTYSWAEVVNLWLTFNKACAYCTTPTPLTEIQAEHVHPISKGGANNLTNLLPSCGPCNSDKRDLLLHEWAHDRARRGKSTVTTTWTPADKRYTHLTTSQSA